MNNLSNIRYHVVELFRDFWIQIEEKQSRGVSLSVLFRIKSPEMLC